MTAPSSDEAVEHPRLFTAPAVVASCVGFAVIGALQALYGPAIPAIRSRYEVTPAVAGFALSAHFVGALLGVLVFYRARGRIGNRILLGASYGLMAVGSLLFAVAPNWIFALVLQGHICWFA
jgi:MFS transporter, FHS family, glucose/mannose:H+ symporter